MPLVLGISKGSLILDIWCAKWTYMVICLVNFFYFVQLLEPQYVWANFQIISLRTIAI